MTRTKKAPAPDKRRRYEHTPGYKRAVFLPVLALLLALIIECFSRGSVLRMLDYVFTRPVYFFYNWLIILTTLTFSELFRHRRSMLFTLSIVWLGLGVASFFVVKQRTQPFTSMDIIMMKDAVKLTTLYYSWPEIILMGVAAFVGVTAFIGVVSRLPKRRRVNYRAALTAFSGLVILTFILCSLGVSWNLFPRYFENLVQAYSDYGFATCFTLTFGERGVDKPDEYSTETVTDIVEEIDESEQLVQEPTATPGPHVFDESDNLAQPNVLFIQLESLFDVNTVIGSEYSEDPTPNFNRLSREFPSGELYVPSIGGGTVNVEFEILSGLNLDFFGAGEYPYSTILQEQTCETIAHNLLQQGYATTALHNHTGNFYSRNEVYSRLGFERFVPLEYMPYVTYTDIGWAEDIVLANEIMKALNSTEQRDFVMTITVESHGKYEDVYNFTEGDPEILALPEQISKPRFANYLHLIHETDAFIGELIEALEFYDEPVVCVFYGDHLPALDITDDILTTGNLYASRYIIWNNYGADFEAPDLQAYRVSANLLKQLGMSGGLITKYHQSAELQPAPDSEYLANLEMLQYDLLYGDQSAYEGDSDPYPAVNLTMGTKPIQITSVSNLYGRLLLNGQNFTEYSSILINDELYPTAFISSTQIIAIVPRTPQIDSIAVAQIALDGRELGRVVWEGDE
ncbi:MAG: LTA synthase family protein [Clostridia bacterium]|nr:LTA synthase family protein [Clostridia bacterium]